MTTIACLLLAATLSAGNDEFERTAVRGAAEIAVARLRAETVAAPSVTGVLASAMLADPSRYAQRETARKSGEAVYERAVGESYRRDVDATLARLAGTRAPEDVFGTNFVRAARALTRDETRRLLTGPYTNAFARERLAACAEQARGLAATIRPPMTAVDSDDEAKVRTALAANIAAQSGRIVFEENSDYISQNLVEPLLADAKREKRRQQEYVRRVRTEALVPSALRADIAWKLGENVRARAAKTENAALRWDVFPSVTNRTLESTVEQRVLGHLAAKVEETPLGFDEKSVRAAYAADPKVHRRADASRAALHAAASVKLVAAAETAVLAETKGAERTELEAYLASRLKSRVVTKPVDEKLVRELDPLLERVRADVSARAFATRYGRLKEGQWYPEAKLADEISARSDFAEAVHAWREMPALKSVGARAAFEEIDALVDKAVVEAFERARAAVVGQTRTVDDVHAVVLAEARDRKESFFRRTPDLKAIVQLLTEATQARWTERKNEVLWKGQPLPKNAAEQHAELFPSVKRRIELVAKEIFEEMQKPEPQDEPPPEEPKMEISIIVSRAGDKVSVKLEQSGKSIVTEESDARLAPFNAAMKKIADTLGGEILKLK